MYIEHKQFRFEDNFFQKMDFTENKIQKFIDSALRDVAIARNAKELEVVFKFTYDALIKLGIALIAKKSFKVRSVPGHHVKILEAMSVILEDEDISILGNQMRQKRNIDLYEGYGEVTAKEAKEYLDFIEKVVKQIRKTNL